MRVSKSFVLTVASLVVVVALAGLSAAQTFTTLYSFAGGNDGANPYCFLIFDKLGNLYGTTDSGGVFAFGTIFELSPNGAGGWSESVLHSFNGTDGGTPLDGLVFDATGNLYGTAGTIFELMPVSPGVWNLQLLFNPIGTAGANPVAGLIFDGPTQRLYGTTPDGPDGAGGAVFVVAPSKAGVWSEQILRNHAEGHALGSLPTKQGTSTAPRQAVVLAATARSSN